MAMATERLNGTVALITGASSGIGEATALALAGAGASVGLVARRGARLEDLAARITATGAKALAIEADITDDAAAREAVARVVDEFGRLDTLVNNAGVMLLGAIVDADASEWARMIDLNVTALLQMTHAGLPHLLAAAETQPRRVADVVNVSSVAGRVARSGSGVYNASKWAVNAFSESLRQEVTKRHVRISLIEPGAVATELFSHNTQAVREMIHQRFGNIERLDAGDIADAVAYVVTRPRHVAINEMLVRPTEQEG
ncbi:MAG: SDR family NAD(P)-dependent oxidoreductase [Candidatus Eremiobacteraeota bacterium]|nr:SDR family NAD(P)-dependent oxidoreductase [Candidatus Eremiobacteraeota bacterium]